MRASQQSRTTSGFCAVQHPSVPHAEDGHAYPFTSFRWIDTLLNQAGRCQGRPAVEGLPTCHSPPTSRRLPKSRSERRRGLAARQASILPEGEIPARRWSLTERELVLDTYLRDPCAQMVPEILPRVLACAYSEGTGRVAAAHRENRRQRMRSYCRNGLCASSALWLWCST